MTTTETTIDHLDHDLDPTCDGRHCQAIATWSVVHPCKSRLFCDAHRRAIAMFCDAHRRAYRKRGYMARWVCNACGAEMADMEWRPL